MRIFYQITSVFITSIFSLSACGDKAAPEKMPEDTSTIKPAQNKMVALPANMKLGLAIVHPPRAKDGFGTMSTQTIGALNGLHNLLAKQSMTLGNVMRLRVTLVPDASGNVDYDSYMAAYKKFFGTKKMPSEPVHTISAARSLPVTGQLVVIEAEIAIPTTLKNTPKAEPKQKADQ